MQKKLLTIFTPTYNRGYTLGRLYVSLQRQINKAFRWLIIDDGSTDNTADLVNNWQREGIIDICYYYQENAGKSEAHNVGVKLTKTVLFACVDSDDYLTDDAVETIINVWRKKTTSECIGILGYRRGRNEILTKFDNDCVEYDTLRGFYDKGMTGDTFLIYRTDIIKKYKFPQFKGEKFVPEAYLYDLLDSEGKLYILRKAVYVCEYLPDGYTRNMRRIIKKNPRGYMAYINQRIKLDKSFSSKCKDIVRYIAVSKCYFPKAGNVIANSICVWLTVMLYPVGAYYYKKLYKSEED